MKSLRLSFVIGCFCLLLLTMAILGVAPVSSQGVEITPEVPQPTDVLQVPVTPTVSVESPFPTFKITLAELGYEERVLNSPYSDTEYTLRLPQGWELQEESFFRLEFSYTYSRMGGPDQALPPLFGEVTIAVDNETQRAFPVEEAALEYSRLRVNLPLSLLNDPARNVHYIKVALDAGSLCEVPHRARLIIHPTSFFSLDYNQIPVTTDLALYPRPFYQRAFELDQVRFVLPAQPTDMGLTGAMAVAAKLGDLAYGMVISGTTDLELLDRLETVETLPEHLIVIGRPESNGVILKLNQLGVLPVPLQERQLSLAGEGPAMIAPGAILTYTLTLTNTTGNVVSSLSLMDTLPAYTHLVACSPPCTEEEGGREVSWSIPSVGAGEALSFTLGLGLGEVITDSMIENTVTLLDAASGPLNVNTLTTTIRSTPLPEAGLISSVSAPDGYFFLQGERAVPETDGIVQEIVSPWDQNRAILVITGLSDEAVYKASRAMSSDSHFPGMKGPFALVREVRLLPELPPEPQAADITFADLGYGDRMLRGRSQGADYFFDIPFNWRLTQAAYLELRFNHSQLLNYGGSSLNVFLNNQPMATVALSDETSLNGKLKVELSPSQVRYGRGNRISIQAEMRPLDECADVDLWLLISSVSTLHLDHKEQEVRSLDLNFYPYPFARRSDLTDVLFVLPPQIQAKEWEKTLQLAASLGNAAGGSSLAPAVTLGDIRSEAELGEYHLIVIGRPLRNPMLQQVNAQLPQPFQPGSDEIEQQIDDVVFRLPPGLSLGLVQLIPSPWNEERAFLAVTGTTDESVKEAADVLTNQIWSLRGNLVLIREGEVNAMDTRGLRSSGVATAVAATLPEMSSVVTTTATPLPLGPTPAVSTSSSKPTRPAWLLPLVGMNALIVIAILAVAFWRARRKRL